MNFSTLETILVAVSAMSLLAIILQGFFIYKVAKSVNIKEKINTDIIEEENLGDSLYERLKFRYRTDPKKFVKASLFFTYFLFFIAIPGINILHNKYMEQSVVEISRPVSKQLVDSVFTAEGKFSNVKPDEEVIWIAVFSAAENKYYLQSRKAAIKIESGFWDCKVAITGGEKIKGKNIKLLAILVNKKSNAYEEIMNNISEENGRPLDTLPADCRVLDTKDLTVK